MNAQARRIGIGVSCGLWLGFTLAGPARADDAQPDQEIRDRWVESPYAAHDTTGANLRVGSAVGKVVHDAESFTALGVTIAGGPRMGRFTAEGQYTYLGLSAPGPSSQHFGSAHRLGVMARADLIRFGSTVVGPNTLLALYGEVGVVQQLHRWTRPGIYDRAREVPLDGSRRFAVVGFGFNLDLRLEQPRGFPNRVGWQLGWQMTASDQHDPDPRMICKGVTCRTSTTTRPPSRDTATLLTSTIAFTW